MIITFCGHRSIYGSESNLYRQLNDELVKIFTQAQRERTLISCYCGGYGAFDALASVMVDKVRAQFPDVKCEKLFITPYIAPSCKWRNAIKSSNYDNIIYPPIEKTPYRFAVVKRNEWMVEQCDLLIAFVRYSFGGAAYMLDFARKKHKKIISLQG